MKIKYFRGQNLWPKCDIKLVSWYEQSSVVKFCIVITRVSSNRISLKRSKHL